MAASFYVGISFPFRRSSTSLPARATDHDLIRQSLVQIVSTTKGERVMRPDFGTNIIHYIFDNNDDLLAELIRSDVFSAVGRYEPRVILTDVQVVRSDETVDVTLLYVVTFTGAAASVGVSFTG
jgi:hypothetical protein